MGKLLGAKTINTANGLRRANLVADRGIGGTGRIRSVSLTIEGVGYVSFSHVAQLNPASTLRLNAAERLEALRGQACPMSAVRVRRYERQAYQEGYTQTPGIDA